MVVQLFAGDSLHEWLHGELLRSVRRRISGLPNHTLLSMPLEEISTSLTRDFEVRPVVLDHDRISVMDHGAEVNAGIRIVVARFAIPYTGSMRVLQLHPPVRPCSGVKVDAVYERTIEIVVETAPTSSEALADAVRGIAREIEGYLTHSNKAVDGYNRVLAETISTELRVVREQAAQAQEMIQGLPFRLYRDEEASRVVMPLQRKVVRPQRQPGGSSFRPNHVLEEADYEATLHVLHDMRTVIERNPSTFAKLALQEVEGLDKVEERYRDLFLVILNTHFKGDVGSEVFNNTGKTDLLIRVEDRNVFIGECKFWRGPASVKEAVDQVLSYHSWRDTKAGLLLFITNVGVKQAIKKAIAELVGHPQYEGPGKVQNDPDHEATRFDVVMRSPSDPDHQIYLALLPFAIPKQPPPATPAPGTRKRSKPTEAPAG